MRDIAIKLFALAIFILVGVFDYWVWSNLINSNLNQIGHLVGFGILAFITIPVTLIGAFIGGYLILED